MTIKINKSRYPAYLAHKARWINCTECPLHKTRRHVCLLRGCIPADILMVGEAPGESEDTLGECFVGPAGQLLDEIVGESLFQNQPRIAYTNILGCIPPAEGGGVRPPETAEVRACRPRLLEMIRLVEPKVVVLLGQKTKQFFPDLEKHLNPKQTKRQLAELARQGKSPAVSLPIPKVLQIVHPSAILRNPARGHLDQKRAVLTLSRVFGEMTCSNSV